MDSTKLKEVLTSRTISARGDVVNTPLDLEQAQYARDALAKAIYDKHFSWLVSRLNASLAPKDKDSQSSVIGILDIYGFEIFPKNRWVWLDYTEVDYVLRLTHVTVETKRGNLNSFKLH